MKELIQTIEFMRNYAEALQRGIDKFIASAPIYAKQQLKSETKKRLNSTADHYISHTSVKLNGYVLVIELDKDDWLTNSLESGVGAFDMKKRLEGSKAKVSKKGYRYMSIPIGKAKGGEGGSTEKSQEFQKKINDVLMKPKFGMKKLKTLMNGTVAESQQVLTDDPMLKGFMRTRQFDSAEAYHGGKKKPTWQYVLFRTMSENPDSKSKFIHPGIKPAHILRATDRWLHQNLDALLGSFLEAELKSVIDRTNLGGG